MYFSLEEEAEVPGLNYEFLLFNNNISELKFEDRTQFSPPPVPSPGGDLVTEVSFGPNSNFGVQGGPETFEF